MVTKVNPSVVADQVFSGRRLNINGDMRVAQRGTKTSMQSGYGGCDRIRLLSNALGVYTLSQSDTSPNNFGQSFKLTTTTANTSPGVDAYAMLQYKFEGHDLQSLKWGTADAEQITVSFWVYTNKTGTYNLEMYAYDNTSNYQANKQYTVSASNTWEKKVITFPSGNNASIPDDNTAALNFNFWLGAGSNYTSGSAGDGNFHSTDANRAAGNVNIADSTSNAFRITGLQIETGTQATPFEYRSIAEELALCQRYCQKYGPYGTNSFPFGPSGYSYAATTTAVGQILPVELRASPSISFNGDGNPELRGGMTDGSNTNRAVTSVSSIVAGGTSLMMNITTSGGGNVTGQVAVLCNASANNFMIYDAEL